MKKKSKKITYTDSGVNIAKAEKLIQDFNKTKSKLMDMD